MSDLRLTRDYPHPPEKVWRALTDCELLSRWLMETDFEPVVGHRFTLRTDPAPGFDGIVRGEVRAVDEPRRIEFSWVGGPIDTVVTWELEAIPGGTRLVVTQRGFAGVKGWLVRAMLGRGSATLYGRHLSALLDAMDADGRAPDFDTKVACPEAGLFARFAALFSSRKDPR
ncbi:MAG: hypothetical protein DHS20C15_32230 [Planctomycetota bacterium]|nr:MAG: hypothetical protein DHS20C15_32230 [Planctomycetota bacterium]